MTDLSVPDPSTCIWLTVNSISPYGLEVAKAVGLPEGSIYRARFSREWVSARVQDALPSISGRGGVLFFRDYATGRIFPVRRIKIRAARWLGSILSIEYDLGSYWPLHDDAKARRDQTDAFQAWWLKAQETEARGGGPGDDLKPLVTIGPWPESITNARPGGAFDDCVSDWRNVVEELSDSAELQSVPFLLVNLPTEKAGQASSLQEGRLLIARGEARTIELISHFRRSGAASNPAMRTPRSIRVKATVDNDCFHASSTEIVLSGGYDVARFSIRANAPGLGSLVLERTPTTGGPHDDHAIALPLASRSTNLRLIVSGLLFTLFVVCYLSPNFIPIMLFHAPASMAALSQDISLMGAAVSLTLLILELIAPRQTR